MRRTASVVFATLILALLATGCEQPGRASMWNVIEEMQGDHKVFAAPVAEVERPRALKAVKDADMPCLKTCHVREKWATAKPYPHMLEDHKAGGKHCIDCHAMGHRSAKADRKVCKECH